MASYTRDPTTAFTELTEYEQQQTPHESRLDDTIVELPFFELMDQLRCPICLSILSETMTTKDCLHRFCHICITKCLQVKKECPTCRKKVTSHRHLRRDENFDKMINILYPDQSVLEQREREILEKIKHVSNQTAFQASYEEGWKSQDQNKKKYRVGQRNTVAIPSHPSQETQPERANKRRKPDTSTPSSSSVPSSTSKKEQSLIEVKLQPHPSDSYCLELERPCVITATNCTLAHLKEHLVQVLTKIPRGPSVRDVQAYTFSMLVDGKGYAKPKLTNTVQQILLHRPPQDRRNRLIIFYSSSQTAL